MVPGVTVLRLARRFLTPGDSARGAAALFGGAVASQLIASVANVVLARFFDPAEFGILGLFLAISGFLVVASSLRLDQAIMLPRSRSLANDLTLVCIGVTLLTAALAGVVALVWRGSISAALGAPALSAWLPILPVAVAAGGVTQALSAWLARHRRFPEIARNRVWQSGSSAVAQLIGRDWHPAAGLVVGTVAGQVVGCAQALRAALRTSAHRLRWRLRGSIASHVRRYRDFPLHSLPEAVLGQCQTMVTAMVIARFWSVEANGQLLMAQRLMLLPLAMATQTTGQVIFQRLAERRSAGEPIGPSLRRAWGRLAVLAAIAALAVYFFAEPVVRVVLGERWTSSGSMMLALLPQVAVLMTFGPTSSIAVIMRRQGLALWTAAVGLSAKALWLAYCVRGACQPTTAVAGNSLIDAAQVLFLNAVIWRAVRREESPTL
jgi:O-antigen/teichoic acid export membrane protein